MTMEPIGTFHCENVFPFEARRQPSADSLNSRGEIRLRAGQNFEQALEDLAGFERIWIIYQFHHNTDWKPKVVPPRGARDKRGVFATRAPYRPNALGLSCVRLVAVDGLKVIVEAHDILDGSPVFDIKPYLPYADSFPHAKVGWLEDIEAERWRVDLLKSVDRKIRWLEERGVSQLRGFLIGQLEFDPLDKKRKRLERNSDGYTIAYRTWRADFVLNEAERLILILDIRSGYSDSELLDEANPYGDKSVHREFSLEEWDD